MRVTPVLPDDPSFPEHAKVTYDSKGGIEPYSTGILKDFLSLLLQVQNSVGDAGDEVNLEKVANLEKILSVATIFKFPHRKIPEIYTPVLRDEIRLPYDPMILELGAGILEDSSSVVVVLKTSDTEANLYVSSKITNPKAKGATFVAMVPVLVKLKYEGGKIRFSFNPEIQILSLWKNRTTEQIKDIQKHIEASLERVVDVIEYINQPNIEYVDHKISEKLNKKRKKKGKLPLYSYKTLKINNSKKFVANGGSSGIARAEYRAHDRRGHWRHYQSGKVSWVRNCRVGDKAIGVIEKEYIIE